MKRQFYFHRENKPLDTDTVIDHVWAGESIRDQRKLHNFRYEVLWSDSSIDHYNFAFKYFLDCFYHLQDLFPKLREAVSITVLEIDSDDEEIHYCLFASAMRVNGHILYFNSLPR